MSLFDIQLTLFYLTTLYRDAVPCNANMCLSWHFNPRKLTITCQVRKADFRVSLRDPHGNNVGGCNPSGCEVYVENGTMSGTTDLYIFEWKNVKEELVEGIWTCVNGRNRGIVTSFVSSKTTSASNDNTGKISTVETEHVSIGDKTYGTKNIIRYNEPTSTISVEENVIGNSNIIDILLNKNYIPLWISIVLFLISFVSCNVMISRKCRSCNSTKIENATTVSTNQQTFRNLRNAEEGFSDYTSIDENQMLSQADLQQQMSARRRHGDNASYCSIISSPTLSSVSAKSNGYLDVIADVYESPVASQCDEHKYNTTSNDVVHVYQNDAFVQ